MTPAQMKKLASKMYGPRFWVAQLAMNLGLETSTVWRWQKKEKLPYMTEVAIKGLWNEHQRLLKAKREMRSRQRRAGLLKPGTNQLRKKQKPARKAVSEISS